MQVWGNEQEKRISWENMKPVKKKELQKNAKKRFHERTGEREVKKGSFFEKEESKVKGIYINM